VLIFLPIFQKNPISHLLVNVNLILYGSSDSLWQPMHKFLQLVPDFEQLTASHTHEYLQGTHDTLWIFKPFKDMHMRYSFICTKFQVFCMFL